MRMRWHKKKNEENKEEGGRAIKKNKATPEKETFY
jgi:hypothetical protein